jgi:hypothetical protein
MTQDNNPDRIIASAIFIQQPLFSKEDGSSARPCCTSPQDLRLRSCFRSGDAIIWYATSRVVRYRFFQAFPLHFLPASSSDIIAVNVAKPNLIAIFEHRTKHEAAVPCRRRS